VGWGVRVFVFHVLSFTLGFSSRYYYYLDTL
jgi:hypothetical protein